MSWASTGVGSRKGRLNLNCSQALDSNACGFAVGVLA